MMEGLNMDIKEFEALPQKDKLNCLFQNQCYSIKLIREYKTYYKVTAIIGSFLLAGMGYLLKIHLVK
jgi:hypothetical protein